VTVGAGALPPRDVGGAKLVHERSSFFSGSLSLLSLSRLPELRLLDLLLLLFPLLLRLRLLDFVSAFRPGLGLPPKAAAPGRPSVKAFLSEVPASLDLVEVPLRCLLGERPDVSSLEFRGGGVALREASKKSELEAGVGCSLCRRWYAKSELEAGVACSLLVIAV